ncbi:MAG TPA: hypothetical protein VFS43_36690 [Polyangiaceae bacterium]|nr:hypothetical protein [Polyangiaceae bacterium]
MDFLRDIGVLSEKEADEVLALIEGLEGGELSLSSLKSQHDAMLGDAESSPLVTTLLAHFIAAAEAAGPDGMAAVQRMVLWAETIDECLEGGLVEPSAGGASPSRPIEAPRFIGLPPGDAPAKDGG